jgi:hypothetical protein
MFAFTNKRNHSVGCKNSIGSVDRLTVIFIHMAPEDNYRVAKSSQVVEEDIRKKQKLEIALISVI